MQASAPALLGLLSSAGFNLPSPNLVSLLPSSTYAFPPAPQALLIPQEELFVCGGGSHHPHSQDKQTQEYASWEIRPQGSWGIIGGDSMGGAHFSPGPLNWGLC